MPKKIREKVATAILSTHSRMFSIAVGFAITFIASTIIGIKGTEHILASYKVGIMIPAVD